MVRPWIEVGPEGIDVITATGRAWYPYSDIQHGTLFRTQIGSIEFLLLELVNNSGKYATVGVDERLDLNELRRYLAAHNFWLKEGTV
jgi:hypothetical protein